MRISGGSAKGRKVGLRKAFESRGDNDELRPTSAKVRKAIFDIISSRIVESRFLDLFAGTGAVGMEALSRGAAAVVFVEENAKRTGIISDMAKKFGFTGKETVIKSPVALFLRKSSMQPFDIIFVDPPYASPELDMALQLIDCGQCMAEGGIVIAEHSSKRSLNLRLTNLRIKKSYRYGDTALTVYEFIAPK